MGTYHPIGSAVRADFRRLYPANAKTPTCCPSDDNRTKVTNSVTSARSLWRHVGPYFWPADLTRTANPIVRHCIWLKQPTSRPDGTEVDWAFLCIRSKSIFFYTLWSDRIYPVGRTVSTISHFCGGFSESGSQVLLFQESRVLLARYKLGIVGSYAASLENSLLIE